MHKTEFGIWHHADLEYPPLLARGRQHVVQDPQPLLGRAAMHIYKVREVPGIPGKAQQAFFQFLAS